MALPDGGHVVIASVGMGSSGIPRRWAASESQPGVAIVADLSDRSATEIADRVVAMKGPGDIGIVSVHWGSNWGYDVDPAQVAFAHRLIDAGVDIVHGHSSHHPRPIEVYRGKLIMYGCGDTIDDYEGIRTFDAFRHELRLLYFVSVDRDSGRLAALRMAPMRMRRMRLEHAPSDEGEWLRSTLEHTSQPFGTRVDTIDGVLAALIHLPRSFLCLSPAVAARGRRSSGATGATAIPCRYSGRRGLLEAAVDEGDHSPRRSTKGTIDSNRRSRGCRPSISAPEIA